MAQERKVGTLGVMALLSLPLVSMGFSVVTPAMATLAEHFAGKDVSWISTLPTLFVVIGTMLAGSIMGKKVKYRTLAIVGSLLYFIGGCAPATFDNYAVTLVCRGVLGFGLGLMSPLGNALIIGLYKGQKQAAMLGYGTLCMNAGGIFLQMLGGALAGISWQITFWGHAFSLIALVLAFFLPEPNVQEPVKEAGPEKKEKMGTVVWVISAMLLLFNIINYPIMMNVSVLFVMRDAGGPSSSSYSTFLIYGCRLCCWSGIRKNLPVCEALVFCHWFCTLYLWRGTGIFYEQWHYDDHWFDACWIWIFHCYANSHDMAWYRNTSKYSCYGHLHCHGPYESGGICKFYLAEGFKCNF